MPSPLGAPNIAVDLDISHIALVGVDLDAVVFERGRGGEAALGAEGVDVGVEVDGDGAVALRRGIDAVAHIGADAAVEIEGDVAVIHGGMDAGVLGAEAAAPDAGKIAAVDLQRAVAALGEDAGAKEAVNIGVAETPRRGRWRPSWPAASAMASSAPAARTRSPPPRPAREGARGRRGGWARPRADPAHDRDQDLLRSRQAKGL